MYKINMQITEVTRPDFASTIDFDQLKSVVINCGEPELIVETATDMNEHLDNLFREFSGQPLIAFYHASLIVRMRRGEDTGRAFRDLWSKEGAFLKKILRLRWLISACDTIIDDETFDHADRALALTASVLTATVKLYETERLAIGAGQQDQHSRPSDVKQLYYIPANVQPLFDGMTTFQIGGGDLIMNLVNRSRAMTCSGGIAGSIFMEILQRIQLNDTVFNRFLNVHILDDTRWDV